MSRKCTICNHEEREEIERDLLRGLSLRNIAIQYRISFSAVQRHKKDHMLITDEEGNRVVWNLEDVLNVPLSIKERAELIDVLIGKALEPLMRPNATLADVPMGFLLQLWRLQQADETTILKATGFLREGRDAQPVDTPTIEVFEQMRILIDGKIRELAERFGAENVGWARAELARTFVIREGLPPGRLYPNGKPIEQDSAHRALLEFEREFEDL